MDCSSISAGTLKKLTMQYHMGFLFGFFLVWCEGGLTAVVDG